MSTCYKTHIDIQKNTIYFIYKFYTNLLTNINFFATQTLQKALRSYIHIDNCLLDTNQYLYIAQILKFFD